MRKSMATAIQTAQEVKEWYARCGFKTKQEAAQALELPSVRTIYRYLAIGLPHGMPGKFIAHRMSEVEQMRRTRA